MNRYGGFLKWYPKMDGLFHGTSPLKKKCNWGKPHFWTSWRWALLYRLFLILSAATRAARTLALPWGRVMWVMYGGWASEIRSTSWKRWAIYPMILLGFQPSQIGAWSDFAGPSSVSSFSSHPMVPKSQVPTMVSGAVFFFGGEQDPNSINGGG